MASRNYPDPVLLFTLKYEGGKANNKRDPGGRTNEGVTQRTYDAACAKYGWPAGDVYDMPAQERDAIYADGYWATVGGDNLADGVDLAVFDYGVNSGPARAKRAYVAAGGWNAPNAAAQASAICAARLSFDKGLAVWNTFGKGWTARVAACEAMAVRMAMNVAGGVDASAPASPMAKVTLNAKAKIAASKAKSRSTAVKGAAGGVVASGAGAGTAANGPLAANSGDLVIHVPWQIFAALGAFAALGGLYLAWRAFQHSTRAQAFIAEAANLARRETSE